MRMFDLDAALAEIVAPTPATIATPATNGPNVAKVADVAAQRVENKPQAKSAEVTPLPARPAPSRPQPDAFPYGRSFDGKPMTWTGKVVSLDEWRRLSEWDKHGSTGKLFCSVCNGWVLADGFPHCHDNNGGAA